MVEDIKRYIKDYLVETSDKTRGHSTFITIKDIGASSDDLETEVQYIDGRIYAIRFLNNEYFEIEDEKLYKVLEALLEGSYEVKTNLISRRKSVVVIDDNDTILPERITSASSNYEHLPRAFSKER